MEHNLYLFSLSQFLVSRFLVPSLQIGNVIFLVPSLQIGNVIFLVPSLQTGNVIFLVPSLQTGNVILEVLSRLALKIVVMARQEARGKRQE